MIELEENGLLATNGGDGNLFTDVGHIFGHATGDFLQWSGLNQDLANECCEYKYGVSYATLKRMIKK